MKKKTVAGQKLSKYKIVQGASKRAEIVRNYPDIAAKYGLDKPVPTLGSGAFGTVWAVDDIAVKITSSSGEAGAIRKIINQGGSLPGVVRYISIEQLHYKGHPQPLWMIRMERLREPPDWFFSATRRLGYPGRSYSVKHTAMKGEPYHIRRVWKDLDKGRRALGRHKITHTDVHDFNIMMDAKGRFKLIDVMDY